MKLRGIPVSYFVSIDERRILVHVRDPDQARWGRLWRRTLTEGTFQEVVLLDRSVEDCVPSVSGRFIFCNLAKRVAGGLFDRVLVQYDEVENRVISTVNEASLLKTKKEYRIVCPYFLVSGSRQDHLALAVVQFGRDIGIEEAWLVEVNFRNEDHRPIKQLPSIFW